jgi:hypothetical protein
MRGASLLLLLTVVTTSSLGLTLRVPDDVATIQAAIDSVSVGDTVLVAAGVYTGSENRDLTFGGKDLVVCSEDGPEATIINCLVGGRGFTFDGGETRESLLEGFTIAYGVVSGEGEYGGAGVLCSGSSPTIRNCILSLGLTVEGFSGGIHCEGGSPFITDCVLEFNDVFGGFGGGISCVNSSALISHCEIRSNRADQGGGIFVSGGSVIIRNCEIVSNSANPYSALTPEGGGIHATSAVVEDCLISGNRVTEGSGGGFYGDAFLARCVVTGNEARGPEPVAAQGGGLLSGETTHLIQCTVAGNNAEGRGDGIHGTGTTVEQCVFWGNSDCGDDIFSKSGMTIICSCFRDLAWEGEIVIVGEQVNEDPLFCDPNACWVAPTLLGEYGLQAGSPCLPGNSPCGRLIGALPVGCPVSATPDPDRAPEAPMMRIASSNPVAGALTYSVHPAVPTRVRIRLFNVRGQLVDNVLDEVLSLGAQTFTWRHGDEGGPGLPAGIYYLRLTAGRHKESLRIVVID